MPIQTDSIAEMRRLVAEAKKDLSDAWDVSADNDRRDALIQTALTGAVLALAESVVGQYPPENSPAPGPYHRGDGDALAVE